MLPQSQPFPACSQLQHLYTLLPGPTRKRFPRWYGYRLCYRSPDAGAPGCIMSWEVTGGRQSYQVALERTSRGELQAHCTCADAVYRGELKADHVCKHVRGLLALGRREAALPGPLGFETYVGGWM